MKGKDPSPVQLSARLALRPKEAAEALGIGERTLRQILPELPHLRVGGVVLLPVDALRGWLLAEAKAEQGRVQTIVDDVIQAVADSGGD